jgi:hypothetical protein
MERRRTGVPSVKLRTFGRRNEEYLADFFLVSKRTLNEDDFQLFQMYFLQRKAYFDCLPKLQLSRGNFFHAVYRIEATLGKVFRELKPYALYPIDEYFTA